MRDQSPFELEFDSERLLHAFRRWARVVVLSTLVAGVTAHVVSAVVAPQYEATAQLYLAPASNPIMGLQDVVLGQSLAKSYVHLASSENILRAAMDEVGWKRDVKAFRDHVSVTQVRETSVINVTFRNDEPNKTAQAANAIASAFIAQSKALQTSLQGSAATELEQQTRAVQDDIRSLDEQLAALRAQLTASPRPGQSPVAKSDMQAEIIQLDGSRQTKQQTLAQFLKARDDMRLAQARAETTVSLWQPATAPEQPISPRPLLNTLLGAIAGGLVAVLAIGLVAIVDDRLADLEDVTRRLGAPPLGEVRLHANPETIAGKLFIRDEPSSPEAEAIRGIRTNVLFASVDKRPRTLLVTSAAPNEGKSVLSANLALAFAESGYQVALIDSDLRRPAQHRLFRLTPSAGLTTLLADAAWQSQLQRFRLTAQLSVIPSGPLPPNPAELLSSGRMSALMQHLANTADSSIVLLDSSPVLAVADAVALGTKVDGCIVVVDSSRTRVASTRRALAALERVRCRVIGVVLNKVIEGEAPYYHYAGYGVEHTTTRGGTSPVKRYGVERRKLD